jgi:peptidoglycan-N-acetylglucosamine deacetylase
MLLVSILASATAAEMAITIDDLPWNAGHPKGYDWLAANRRLVAAIEERHVPVTAFVNCDPVTKQGELGTASLDVWRKAGIPLENHTASHMSLLANPLEAWVADAQRCHTALAKWGRTPTYFRFPYLKGGDTVEKRDGAYAAIAAMGEKHAPVTIDNEEWLLASIYAESPDKQAAVASFYAPYMVSASDHFRDLAKQKFGRDPAQILLLHVNMLSADHFGEVLDALEADGWTFVSLEQALRDPLYALPDTYLGNWGNSWLHRVVPMIPGETEWEGEQDAAIKKRFYVDPP